MMNAQRQPAEQQHLRSFYETVVRPLTKSREPYIDAESLGKLRIGRSPLSFTTGQLPKGGNLFFEPVLASTIEEWLARSKPWTKEGRDFTSPNYEEELLPSNAQVEARFFWYKIKAYLTQTDDQRAPRPIPDQTKWRLQGNPFKSLISVSHGQINWKVEAIQSFSLGGDLWTQDDVEKPHVICFITSEASPKENAVLTCELAAISVLAHRTAIEPSLRKHCIVPITVITASCRDVRIVQGIFDVKKARLDLRISKTINFRKGIVANWNDFLTLLGWVVAKPIGRTF